MAKISILAAIGAGVLPLLSWSASFGGGKSSATTGVFGFDRAALPEAGSVLRTDAFVTPGAADRTFRLDDLVVLGYDRDKGTAGSFWFYEVGFEAGADRPGIKREADGRKRELAFYWYDVPTGDKVRAPGWYDADGVERWADRAFEPGTAFCFQGGGLTLETNGLAFDEVRTNVVEGGMSAIVGNTRPRRVALREIRFQAESPQSDDVRLRRLASDLTVTNEHVWSEADERWEPDEGASFDMGEAFWVRSYGAGGGGIVTSANAAPVYRWKSTAGSVPAPDAETNVVATTVYLFDAKKLSAKDLVARLRGGAELSAQKFVIGRRLDGGVLVSGDEISYADEPLGAVWGAYMAFEYRVGDRRYAYVTETVEVMGVAFGVTEIAFGAPGSSVPSTSPQGESYDEAGWYLVSASVPSAGLWPGNGVSECRVSAENANVAAGLVRIFSSDEKIVSNEAYAKYFRLVAEPQSPGVFVVRATLDAAAIELDKSTCDLAAHLSAFAAAGGTTVTVEISAKAGLRYRVLSASAVGGPYEKGEGVLATGAKTPVGVKVPEGGGGFFKVEAGAK